jgi:hypothetical protein
MSTDTPDIVIPAELLPIDRRFGSGPSKVRAEAIDALAERAPPAMERARAYLYRAELALRIKNADLAQTSFALARSMELTEMEQATSADEFGHVETLLRELET